MRAIALCHWKAQLAAQRTFGEPDKHFDALNTVNFNNLIKSVPDDVDWDDPVAALDALGIGTTGSKVPRPKIVSPEELHTQARELSGKIFDHYERLQAILQRHESTIQKRWAKKTRKQRREVLLDCWPNMSPTH